MLSQDREKEIKELLLSLNIDSNNLELFDVALTHPSYNFERNKEGMPDYERLEFLGDSVLRLCASNYLYNKFENYDEGNLTKIRSYIVSDEFLSKEAFRKSIDKYLNIGIHEEKDGGRQKESILACSFEAIIGAIYLSCNFDTAKKFIYKIYDDINDNFNELLNSYNSKEILQQYTQGLNKDLPEYEIINETGQAHDKTYEVIAKYHGKILGTGKGKTKKEAEKNAAYTAILKLNLIEAGKNE